MKVLVTGHLGYIGTVLTPMLTSAGHEVVGLDSDLYANSTFGTLVSDVPSIIKDIRDVELDDVKGFDAILHLAGLSNDPLGDLNPELTYDINYRASVQLAQLAKQAGVPRFIFSSSCSNYGAAGNDMLTEEASFNPVTPYGQSKVLVEKEVAALADDDFSPTFLRNSTAYGVSPRLRFDLVLNSLTAWAYSTGRVFLKSDGTSWRPIVHIEDIALAFLCVLEAPRDVIHNESFNVAVNEDNYQIYKLAELVCEVIPESYIEFAHNASPTLRQFNVGKDLRNYRVDASKIQRVIPSFQPRWNARKGAEQLYEAFKQIGLRQEDFEGPRYQRVGHIKHLLASNQLDRNLRWTTNPTEEGADKPIVTA